MAGLPRATARPATRPRTPLPGTASKSVVSWSTAPRAWAPARIASASGCSEPRSREAANDRTSASSMAPSEAADVLLKAASVAITSVSSGFPSVKVPVLSTIRTSTFASLSSAAASRTSTPAWAPRPVETMIDMGVARPRAHGQAMTSTLTATTTA